MISRNHDHQLHNCIHYIIDTGFLDRRSDFVTGGRREKPGCQAGAECLDPISANSNYSAIESHSTATRTGIDSRTLKGLQTIRLPGQTWISESKSLNGMRMIPYVCEYFMGLKTHGEEATLLESWRIFLWSTCMFRSVPSRLVTRLLDSEDKGCLVCLHICILVYYIFASVPRSLACRSCLLLSSTARCNPFIFKP